MKGWIHGSPDNVGDFGRAFLQDNTAEGAPIKMSQSLYNFHTDKCTSLASANTRSLTISNDQT